MDAPVTLDALRAPLLNKSKDECEDGKNKSRQKGDRWKSDDDALQQLEEIEKAQKAVRAGKLDKLIDSIDKSKQRLKHRLKKY